MLTEDVALEFRERLDVLVQYYQHRRVTLQIHSEGGQLNALRQILDGIYAYRAKKVVFATEAQFMAYSAAAVLLASGEPGCRRVSRQTSLLFHYARHQMTGPTVITADAAVRLAKMLNQADARLERTIVSHLAQGFGGVVRLAAEGLARCRLLQQEGRTVSTQLWGLESDQLCAETEGVNQMWLACSTTGSDAPYQQYLSAVFARDSCMEIIDAYALALIDEVDQVPALLPQAAQVADRSERARLSV
jgi:ATP-dependent protease ClpP protease subunit